MGTFVETGTIIAGNDFQNTPGLDVLQIVFEQRLVAARSYEEKKPHQAQSAEEFADISSHTFMTSGSDNSSYPNVTFLKLHNPLNIKENG